jgi:hypothetical protein
MKDVQYLVRDMIRRCNVLYRDLGRAGLHGSADKVVDVIEELFREGGKPKDLSEVFERRGKGE